MGYGDDVEREMRCVCGEQMRERESRSVCGEAMERERERAGVCVVRKGREKKRSKTGETECVCDRASRYIGVLRSG